MFDEGAFVRYLKSDEHGHIERRDLTPTEVLMVEIARFDNLANAETEGRLTYFGSDWHRQRHDRLRLVLDEQRSPVVRAALCVHRWKSRTIRSMKNMARGNTR